MSEPNEQGCGPLRGAAAHGGCKDERWYSTRYLHRASAVRPARFAALAVAGTLAGGTAFAQSNPAAVLDRQNEIILHQQQEQLRQSQERALPATQAPGGTDLNAIRPQVGAPDIGPVCREIRDINIGGDTSHLPAAVREHITRTYAGHCLDAVQIESILAILTKSYIDRGYVTTRAYLPEQDLRTGTLRVTIVEGRIERYDVQSHRRGAQWVTGAFPAGPGSLLNLRDLEQGVDQINRLTSNNATLDLQPGDGAGQTVVVVRNPSATPIHLYTELDNSGLDATGRNSLSATVTLDSLLGLNEQIAVTRMQSVFPFDGGHRSDATSVLAELPFGYNTFTFNASQSNYTNRLNLASGNSIDSTGRTDTLTVGASRVIYRDQANRLSIGADLTKQSLDSWLGGQYVGIASRDLTWFDVGPTLYSHILGGIFNGHLGFSRGVGLFGALRDPDDLPGDLPHAQFSKLGLDLGYSRQFQLGGHPVLVSTQFSGQQAYDTLYGTQQMLIGGPASVRGFLNTTLSGDSGFYVRNEIDVPWRFSLGRFGAVPGRVYAGLDVGHVNNRASGAQNGTLSGATLGITAQWKAASADLSVAHSITMPDGIAHEGTIFIFRLSCSL